MTLRPMTLRANIELMPAHADDAAALARLQNETMAGTLSATTENSLRRLLGAKAARGWVASADGSGPAGFVLAFAAADEAEILSLCVGLQHRRRGVARALLRELISQLAAEGATRLHLEVRASNHAARLLYERTGFAETGLRKRYYDGIEDAVIMTHDMTRRTP